MELCLSRPGRVIHSDGSFSGERLGKARNMDSTVANTLSRKDNLPEELNGDVEKTEPKQVKGPDVIVHTKTTLQELYTGVVRKLLIEKNVVCAECEGKGAKKEKLLPCPACRGQGFHVIFGTHPHVGVVDEIPVECPECQGHKHVFNHWDACPRCQGVGIYREQKVIKVEIHKGTSNGQELRFPEEGNQIPGLKPGDMIVIVDVVDHPIYHRKGNDLMTSFSIGLVESLCGFQRYLTTLDKRKLLIKSKRGDVLKEGHVIIKDNEGMPVYQDDSAKGRLHVFFHVSFPKENWFPLDKIDELESLLPPRQEVTVPEGATLCKLRPLPGVSRRMSRSRRNSRTAYDEPGSPKVRVRRSSKIAEDIDEITREVDSATCVLQ